MSKGLHTLTDDILNSHARLLGIAEDQFQDWREKARLLWQYHHQSLEEEHCRTEATKRQDYQLRELAKRTESLLARIETLLPEHREDKPSLPPLAFERLHRAYDALNKTPDDFAASMVSASELSQFFARFTADARTLAAIVKLARTADMKHKDEYNFIRDFVGDIVLLVKEFDGNIGYSGDNPDYHGPLHSFAVFMVRVLDPIKPESVTKYVREAKAGLTEAAKSGENTALDWNTIRKAVQTRSQ